MGRALYKKTTLLLLKPQHAKNTAVATWATLKVLLLLEVYLRFSVESLLEGVTKKKP